MNARIKHRSSSTHHIRCRDTRGASPSNPCAETLDDVNRQTGLSSTRTSVDADGRFRLVLPSRDASVFNWLDLNEARRLVVRRRQRYEASR